MFLLEFEQFDFLLIQIKFYINFALFKIHSQINIFIEDFGRYSYIIMIWLIKNLFIIKSLMRRCYFLLKHISNLVLISSGCK